MQHRVLDKSKMDLPFIVAAIAPGTGLATGSLGKRYCLCLSFPICKVGIIIEPTSGGAAVSCKASMSLSLELRPVT